MLSPETLSFGCPHCHVPLTVPARLAGVTGPCPSCRQSITAPLSAPVAIAPLPAAEAPAPAPAVAAVPPVPTPLPASAEPVLVEVAPEPPPESTRIRPEPRHVKERGSGVPIAPRHTTEDERLRRSAAPPASGGRRAKARIPRMTGAAVFCTAAAVTIYLLVYFFLPQGPHRSLERASGPLDSPQPAAAAAPPPAEEPVLVKPASPPPAEEPVLVRPAVDEPSPQPGAETAESPLALAGKTLEAFLAGKDAASRVGLVEPAATAAEMDITLLKGPLPEVSRIVPELPRHHPAGQFTDFPFRVSFVQKSGKDIEYAVLVRQRGSQPPKVFLPAFLDLAGGGLARFTREPNDADPAVFHVILDPLSVCHDENVPGAERKITFKLLPGMFGKEIARAHVSSGSRFARMVGDPNSSLRWGVRMRATVTVQWNRKEDPEKPYLELMNINSLEWGS